MIVSSFLLLISLLLFYKAPDYYNNGYCVLCLVVFGLVCLGLYNKRYRGEGLVNFNTFFLVAFFFVSYAYPVFIHPTALSDMFDMNHMITSSSICKCTALCTVAICSYYFGYNIYTQSKHIVIKKQISAYFKAITKINNKWYDISVFGVFFVLFLFFTTKQEIGIEVSYAPFLFIIFLICTIISLVSNTRHSNTTDRSWYKFYTENKKVLFVSGVIILIYMVIGDRLMIVELGLTIISTFSLFYKKMRTSTLAVIMIIGFVLMTLVVWTRGSSGALRGGSIDAFVSESNNVMSEQSEGGLWSYTIDLTGRFQELSYGYEMTNRIGHVLPEKIFVTLFSPIPLMPNVISNLLLGVPTSKISAGYYIATDSDTHAGSHCVIDIYMPWGVPGLLILFTLFGIVVAYFDKNKYNSLYCSVGYVVLIYQSIFIARGTIFDIYRSLVWAMVIIYLYNKSKIVRNVRQ